MRKAYENTWGMAVSNTEYAGPPATDPNPKPARCLVRWGLEPLGLMELSFRQPVAGRRAPLSRVCSSHHHLQIPGFEVQMMRVPRPFKPGKRETARYYGRALRRHGRLYPPTN
jgi:hypothetical protein